MLPAFPYPWTATVAPSRSMPKCRAARRVVNWSPRAVASSRPAEPPIWTGFPVTTAGMEYPRCML